MRGMSCRLWELRHGSRLVSTNLGLPLPVAASAGRCLCCEDLCAWRLLGMQVWSQLTIQ